MSDMTINNQGIPGNIWADGIQNGRCGSGNYHRETTFSLNDVLGNNIPSNATIAGKLTRTAQAGVFVGSEVLDSRSASVTPP